MRLNNIYSDSDHVKYKFNRALTLRNMRMLLAKID